MVIVISKRKEGKGSEKWMTGIKTQHDMNGRRFSWSQNKRLAIKFKDLEYAMNIVKDVYKGKVRIYLDDESFTVTRG